MRQWAGLLWTSTLLGCGGKVTVSPPPDSGGLAECITSTACGPAQRCDYGTCVADDGCPEARDSELLFEAPSDSHWSMGFPYVVALDGREYVTGGGPSIPIDRGTIFVELGSGREHLLDHEPGNGACMGDPPWCAVRLESGSRLLWGLELGPDRSVWTASTTLDLLSHRRVWMNDADFRAGRLALGGVGTERTVDLFDLESRAVVASVPLEDRTLLRVLPREGDASHRLVASRTIESTMELSVSSLELHEGWRPIYTGPPQFMLAIAIPHGSGWYVLRDEGAQEFDMHVYRSTDGRSELVGASPHPALRALDGSYYRGERALEPGPAAYALTCENGTCTSYLAQLDPVDVEQIGSMAIPDAGALTLVQTRWLACGAADAVISASDGTFDSGEPIRLWSIRIPGREGIP